MKNFKKIIGGFCVLSLACFTTSFASTGIVNTPAARVREKASTDSEIITNIYEDDEVEVLETEENWYKIKFNGKTGYVSKSLIKISEKNSETTTNTTNTTNTQKEDETNTENKVSENNQTSENSVSDNNVTQNKVGNFINKDISLRLLPNFASNEISLLTKNTEVKIEKEINNWVKVSISDNTRGWVLKSSISETEVKEENEENTTTVEDTNNTADNTTNNENKEDTNTVLEEETTENKKGKIKVETANVRKNASTTSDIIGKLDEGDEVTILEETGDWYKISTSKISSGYISKSLVSTSAADVSSRSLEEPREQVNQAETTANNSSNGEAIVQFAKQYLGTSYVSGGKSPETGFDCSGFTGYVFRNFGTSLGATAASQDGVGTAVERSNLKPGDLILFFDEGKTKIGHTGIYIGNNEFIHAANPQRGVVTDNLSTNSYYNERYVSARRIVE